MNNPLDNFNQIVYINENSDLNMDESIKAGKAVKEIQDKIERAKTPGEAYKKGKEYK